MSKCLGNKVRRKHLSAITPSRAIQRNSLVASEAPTHRHAISLALVCCSFVCALVLMLSAGVLFSMCRARANEWMRVRVFQCIAFILFYIYLYSKCMYHFFSIFSHLLLSLLVYSGTAVLYAVCISLQVRKTSFCVFVEVLNVMSVYNMVDHCGRWSYKQRMRVCDIYFITMVERDCVRRAAF